MDKGQEALMEGVVSAIESLGTACLEKGASFVQGASLKQTAFLEQGTSLKQAACLEQGPSHPEPERAEAFYHDLLAFFFRFLVFCMAEEGPRSDRKGRNQALLRKFRKGCSSLGAKTGKKDQALCKTLQAAMNQQGGCLTGDGKNQAGDRKKLTGDGKKQAGTRKKLPLFKHHSLPLSDGALLRGLAPLFFPFPHARDQSIDFSSLPPEILGVLYERLLLQRPRIVVGGEKGNKGRGPAPCFTLEPCRVTSRRAGSYYTDRTLVQALVATSLVPVLVDRLQKAGLPAELTGQEDEIELDCSLLTPAQRRAGSRALLGCKVVDPACGGAAFLAAALDYLSRMLTRLRQGARKPAPSVKARAVQEVLHHCIHGVDRDPMAVALTRMTLWLQAGAGDREWGVLEKKIRQGNALLGAPLEKGRCSPTKTAADQWTADCMFPSRPGEDVPQEARSCSEREGFFHWRLEFPHLFTRKENGFDCVLANPPWERIKLQEREFFLRHAPHIASAGKASQRKALIAGLEKKDPRLFARYQAYLRESAALSRFFRTSGRYDLAARGDPNIYLFFAVLCRDLLTPRGRVGMVVPSGIATDLTASALFRDLVEQMGLVSLFDFINTEKVFPGIAAPNRFCLLTLAGSGLKVKKAVFQFYATSLEDLKNKDRTFTLSRADLQLMNPDTLTCPPFGGRRDAALARRIYRNNPVLGTGNNGPSPWGVNFWNMFHMSNDSHLFRTAGALRKEGYRLDGKGDFQGKGGSYVRLYESKLMHNLDHRHNSFKGVDPRRMAGIKPAARAVTPEEAQDPATVTHPRYWVPETAVQAMADRRAWHGKWFLCLRSVTNVITNRRSAVASILPRCGIGNSATIFQSELPARKMLLLAACLSSFAFDAATRMKLGGPNLNFFILKQLPVPPPDRFDRPFQGRTVADFVFHRALTLVYTAYDLTPFARDCGYSGPPFTWDEGERSLLRAELDALFFLLYGMSFSDVKSVLQTFPILQRKEEARWGEFRSRRLVLDAYARLSESY